MDKLNFFVAYGRGKDYLENNLTRAFVLTLRSSPLFFLAFLDRILPERMRGPNAYLQLPASPGFRLQVKSREGFVPSTAVVGVALVDGEGTAGSPSELPPADKETVPDAVIQFEEQLAVVIEAKRTSEIRWSQLSGHMARVPAIDGDQDTHWVLLTWQAMGELAYTVLTHLRGGLPATGRTSHEQQILGDFLDYLEEIHPTLAPARTLADALSPSDPRTLRRVRRLLESLSFGAPTWHRGYAYEVALPARIGLARSLAIQAEDHPQAGPGLGLYVHLGDTAEQGRLLWKSPKAVGRLVNRLEKRAEPFSFSAPPYLKFAQQGTGLAWFWPPVSAATVAALIDEGKLPAIGRHLRPTWNTVLERAEAAGVATAEGQQQFKSQFESSRRQFADLSIGLCLGYRLAFHKAQQLDARGELKPALKAIADDLVTRLKSAV